MSMESLNSIDSSRPTPPPRLPQSPSPSRPRAPRPSMYGPDGGKEKRNPSVTPRKFNRFFTPRSLGSFQLSSARQALQDITQPTANHVNHTSAQSRYLRCANGQENSPSAFTRDLKRRKLLHTPDTSPDSALPTKGTCKESTPLRNVDVQEDDLQCIPSSPCERAVDATRALGYSFPMPCARRIVPFAERGLNSQLLQRSFRNSSRLRPQHYLHPVNDWQDETASFYSTPSDVHMCTSTDGQRRCIPFCAASCNTNSLVAIGDEEGRVQLLESGRSEKSKFQDAFLSFRVHGNAIIDLCFSEDDSLLATASGDQTARVVDMVTQTTLSVLGNHSASLKQVRFQPGQNNANILATSSRDGSVQIWDLRCKGSEGPIHQLPGASDIGPSTRSRTAKVSYERPINTIHAAHQPSPLSLRQVQSQGQVSFRSDAPSRGEVPGRIGDVSVTAISFLSTGQEHLLLTSSEADTTIKLWDIRALQNRRKTQTPISCTNQPQSHTQWRHFGISSLNLSTDGSRLFALCKDNTIYAYSTAHLILGHAPELSPLTNPNRRASNRGTQQALGPIYGFRHPQLHATSFYVKSAIRKARNGNSEMLAVGSSDGCAILFPTDERYFPKASPSLTQTYSEPPSSSFSRLRPSLRRTGSGLTLAGRVDDSIPIYTHGTPLIRGHDREVGSLAWGYDGGLVTVGDDYIVRRWVEGSEARDLRIDGEAGGRRWGCGWADVTGGYDED